VSTAAGTPWSATRRPGHLFIRVDTAPAGDSDQITGQLDDRFVIVPGGGQRNLLTTAADHVHDCHLPGLMIRAVYDITGCMRPFYFVKGEVPGGSWR
jgi:hypothetical protein